MRAGDTMDQPSLYSRLSPLQDRDARLAAPSPWLNGRLPTRILVPTDLSYTSQAVVQHGLSWVDAMAGELLLLHVIPDVLSPWSDPMDTLFIDRTSVAAHYGELCEQGHSRLVTWLPCRWEPRIRPLVAVGNPAQEIVRVAREQQADLILMGASHKSRWRQMLWGSVTDQVVRRAPVPVITVASPGP